MSRTLAAPLVSLAVIALFAGALWYRSSEEATSDDRTDTGVDVAHAPTPLVGRPDAEPGALLEVDPRHEPAARETVAGAEEALARASAVVGRVVFPPGTPDDEQAWIVADGDGSSARRVPIAADGSFRAPFDARDTELWIDLDARYLSLFTRRVRRGTPDELVLEPKLVGRLVLTASPPSGWSGALDGLLNVYAGERSSERSHVAERRLDGWGDVVFDAVECGPGFATFDGADLVLGELAFELHPGVTTALDLDLWPGVRIGGRVVDERGEPLARVLVEAMNRGDFLQQETRSTLTDDAGAFGLRALHGGQIHVWAEGDGRAPASVPLGVLRGGTTISDLEIVLASGGFVAGRVTWPDGTPAPAHVVVSDTAHAGATRDDRCDDTGAFRVTGLLLDPCRVTASATRSQSVPVVDPTDERTSLDLDVEWTATQGDVALGREDLALVLSPGLVLEGRVVDDRGDPVPAFHVTAASARVNRTRQFVGTNGLFAVEGFTPGSWRISVWAAGYAIPEPPIVTMPRTTPLEVVLSRGSAVRGVVLDALGEPAHGATVEVHGAKGGTSMGTSDADGRFEITGLAAGRIVLSTRHADDASCSPLELELGPGEIVEDVVLRSTPGARIRGEAIARDGGPGVGFEVGLTALDRTPRLRRSAVTDDRGLFEIGGLPAGSYELYIRGEQGLRWTHVVTLVAGETADVRIETPDEGTVLVRGRLRGAGEPLANTSVSLKLQGAKETSGSSRTDSSGSFEVRVEKPGRYRLWISRFEWSATEDIDVPAVSEHVVDRDVPLGRIAGRVTSSVGTPLPDVSVQVRGEDAYGHTITGADGGYELVVPAGDVLVGVRSTENGRPVTVRANGRLRGVDLVDDGG